MRRTDRSQSTIVFALIGAGLLSLIAAPRPAHAHRLDVLLRVVDGRLVAEASYVDGSPTGDASVRIEEPGGRVIASGTTDAAGRFTFRVERATALRVVVKDGQGHRAEVLLTADAVDRLAALLADAELTASEPVADSRDDDLLAGWPMWARIGAGIAAILAVTGVLILARRRPAATAADSQDGGSQGSTGGDSGSESVP